MQAQGQATRIVAQQFESGFWFKQDLTFVNIRSVLPDMTLLGVRIYEFDRDLQLKSLRVADSGTFVDDGLWRLYNAQHHRVRRQRCHALRAPIKSTGKRCSSRRS